VIPAGWQPEWHPATKTFHQFPFFTMAGKTNRRDTACSTSRANSPAYEKQNGGEPSQTAGRSSHHFDGHRPVALHGSRWGRESTYNASDCIRFTIWNIGTMTGKSAEVVEMFRLRADIRCTQEKTSSAMVLGRAYQSTNCSGKVAKMVMHG